MKKQHELNAVVIDGQRYEYFAIRERNDLNGNPRYRVFIIDPDGPAVHESIFKCYESQIPERVQSYIEYEIGVMVPF